MGENDGEELKIKRTMHAPEGPQGMVQRRQLQPGTVARQREDLQQRRMLPDQRIGDIQRPFEVDRRTDQQKLEDANAEIIAQLKRLENTLGILRDRLSDHGILAGPQVGTDSFTNLQRCLTQVLHLSHQANEDKEVSPAAAMAAILQLSEAANGYYDLHRGFRFTSVGDDRKNAAKYIQKKLIDLFAAVDVTVGGKGMEYSRDRAILGDARVTEGPQAKKKVAELAAHYRKWAIHFAKREGFEREAIQEKVNLIKPYMRDIEIFKVAYPQSSQWSSDTAEIIKIYQEYKMKHHLFRFLEKSADMKKKLADPLQEMTLEQVETFGVAGKETKFSAKAMDAALTDEQKKAVEAIDQWFVRNHNNAGFLGSVIGVRNHHEEIITALFKKTKRERLFIYYLIETGKRKTSSPMDAFLSQEDYVPNLESFKNQMVASKLRIIGHATGSYIYMHKLAEAMQINHNYRDLLKDVAELENQSKNVDVGKAIVKDAPAAVPVNQEKTEDEIQLEHLIEDRTEYIGELYVAMKELSEEEKKKLKSGKAGKKLKDDQALLKQAEMNRQKLIEADELIGKLEKKSRKVMNRGMSEVGNVSKYAAYVSSSEKVMESTGKGVQAFWGLKDTVFGQVNFLGANIGGNSVLITSELLAATVGLFSLAKGHSSMHKADILAGVAGIIKSLSNSARAAMTGLDAMRQVGVFKGALDVAAYTQPVALKAFGVVTAGAAVGLSTYKAASGALDVRNAYKASSYFKKKAKNVKPEDSNTRELRYEKNMSKLAYQQSITKTAFGVVDTAVSGLALGACFVPGIGQVVLAGTSGLAAIASGIGKAISASLIRKSLFDTYFNIDDLHKRAIAKMEEEGRPILDKDAFKTQLRRRVAAAAGFSGIGAAADQIAFRYATFVYDKLHGPEKLEPGEERDAYIQLVKAFGLSYSEKKKRPVPGALAKKMAGR